MWVMLKVKIERDSMWVRMYLGIEKELQKGLSCPETWKERLLVKQMGAW